MGKNWKVKAAWLLFLGLGIASLWAGSISVTLQYCLAGGAMTLLLINVRGGYSLCHNRTFWGSDSVDQLDVAGQQGSDPSTTDAGVTEKDSLLSHGPATNYGGEYRAYPNVDNVRPSGVPTSAIGGTKPESPTTTVAPEDWTNAIGNRFLQYGVGGPEQSVLPAVSGLSGQILRRRLTERLRRLEAAGSFLPHQA